jgi:NTE family protein
LKKIILYSILLLICSTGFSQRVGLVFSGGGATGFAHIGVLKALEENNIPIDFITGTSAGALIGAMYASGYSPTQIEQLVLTDKFQRMSSERLEEDFRYSIHNPDRDAELMSIRVAKDSILQKSLPTNILNPTFLDLEVLNILGNNLDIGNGSFDSLFVPFRCIASNIATKESVLFREGNLNQAVRASMTYPFFINPIEIDGILMFDGGLYNNFPANEMYNEFDPDFIIGSNVSYNEAPPKVDDLMSQIKNLFSAHSDYGLPCESGIIIEPDLGDIGTFDFDKIEEAIEIGYRAALEKIDSIKYFVSLRVSSEELQKSRALYNGKKKKIRITSIVVKGVSINEQKYIERKLINSKKNEILEYDQLKKRYLRLYQSEHVLSMFPMLYPNSDSTQELVIDFRKEKPFKAAFGGHYSSKPVNTGFLSLSYSDFTITPITLYANTYFGKFYGSVKTGIKFYLPTKTTSYVEPYFAMNRWDYFKSFSTFFEPSKPSYLVLNERFWSIKYVIPASSKSKLIFDFTNGTNENTYYQTDNFTQVDTTDNTSFLYYSPGFEFTVDKLNRKQFESAGSYFSFKSRFIHGIETTVPGSTSNNNEITKSFKNWFYVKANYKNYFIQKGLYRLGIQLESVYSTQPFFENYTASILSSHAFQPIPDSKTGFYDDFRANKYFGAGLMNVFTLKDKVDFRIEAYIFQPINRILSNDGVAYEGELFSNRFGIASASLIYHSVIGPVRATVNYFDSQSQLKPLSFQLSLGYVIFNSHGLK